MCDKQQRRKTPPYPLHRRVRARTMHNMQMQYETAHTHREHTETQTRAKRRARTSTPKSCLAALIPVLAARFVRGEVGCDRLWRLYSQKSERFVSAHRLCERFSLSDERCLVFSDILGTITERGVRFRLHTRCVVCCHVK